MNSVLNYYLYKLGILSMPSFLTKYLKAPSFLRLKKVGYFCGMDYASKDIYDFSEVITRYDHSISTALLTSMFTSNKKEIVAALLHDISTPCFSHVIDYMNEDFINQESTEEFTLDIIKNDEYLVKCLEEDGLSPLDVSCFKNYSIVDNKRPKLCADRLDGIILNGFGWTKLVGVSMIDRIIDSLDLYINSDIEKEIGFNDKDVALDVVKLSIEEDKFCHSKEDNYMMNLLSLITKYSIEKGYISYKDLYILGEDDIFSIFDNSNDSYLNELLYKFRNIKKVEIDNFSFPNVKERKLNPICNGIRVL